MTEKKSKRCPNCGLDRMNLRTGVCRWCGFVPELANLGYVGEWETEPMPLGRRVTRLGY